MVEGTTLVQGKVSMFKFGTQTAAGSCQGSCRSWIARREVSSIPGAAPRQCLCNGTGDHLTVSVRCILLVGILFHSVNCFTKKVSYVQDR